MNTINTSVSPFGRPLAERPHGAPFAEQVRQFMLRGDVTLVSAPFGVLWLSLILFDVQPWSRLAGWICLVLVPSALACFAGRRYLRAVAAGRAVDHWRSLRWQIGLRILTALGWGMAIPMLYVDAPTFEGFVILLLLVVISSVNLHALMVFKSALFSVQGALWLPAMATFLWLGDRPHMELLAGVLALLAILGYYGLILHRDLVASLLQQAERHVLLASLSANEQRLRAITDAMGEGLYVRGADGVIQFANPQAQRLLGYSSREMVGQRGHSLFHHHYPDGREYPVAECWIERAVASGGAQQIEECFIRKDGSPLPVMLTISPLRHDEELLGAVISFRDITQEKATREALIESHRKLRRLIDLISDCVWEVDEHDCYTYVSDQVSEVLGYEPIEVTGRQRHEFLPAESVGADPVGAAIQSRQPFSHIETISLHKYGHRVALESSGTPIFDADGAFRGYRGVDRNITSRKRFELATTAALDAAAASARAKSEFLANISHEIRTPLNGVIGMTELTLATPLSDEQREYLGIAHESAGNLLALINDILDYSKIEAEQMALEQVPFALGELFAVAVRGMLGRALQKDIELAFEPAPELPAWVIGDPTRLRQVVNNLLGNAIKFTPHGKVSVRLALIGAQKNALRLQCEVQDSGVGIPANRQSAIFEAFTQADAATARQFGGTGLGLPICRRLVSLMGGEISVRSVPGEGATFIFTFLVRAADGQAIAPTPAAPDPAAQPPAAADLAPLRVLLAEDNPVNQKVAITMLERLGHQVTLAEDGEQAWSLASSQDFDIVLMDVRMPVLDGYEATRRLRRQSYRRPILAMTAHAGESFRQECLRAGMDDYLTKPVSQAGLSEALTRWRLPPAFPGLDHIAPLTPLSVAEPIAAASAEAVYDEAVALGSVGGEHSLLKTLAQMVLSQIDSDLPKLQREVAAASGAALSDLAPICDGAHRLKGSLGAVGGMAAQAACRKLEMAARSLDRAVLDEALLGLEAALDRLRPTLRRLAEQVFS